MRVVILHNRVSALAAPDDADVLVQADAVETALTALGHEVEQWGCDLDLESLLLNLSGERPDLVFNLVEGLNGQGRLIHLVPAVLDTYGPAYTGSPAEAFFLTSQKPLSKMLLRGAGLPTPDWLVPADLAPWAAAATGEYDRWIIKSAWEDASLGLDDDAVAAGGAAAARARLEVRADGPGAPWFAEAYIDGREFNLALLDGPAGPEVLPAAEMLFPDYPPDKPRIVGYAAKWHEDSFEYAHTVRSLDPGPGDDALIAEMRDLALRCWRLFGLRGWARVDFRVDAAGRPWILEVNVNPCLSPDAGFAAALQRAGIGFPAAVGRIVQAAVR